MDGATDHYSQFKYTELDSDMALLDSEEMRLIEAEVLWRNSDFPGAIAIMDALRAAAGLGPLAASTDSDQVLDYLLHERFRRDVHGGDARGPTWLGSTWCRRSLGHWATRIGRRRVL